MQLIRREQGRGYVDTCLWVPKEAVNVDGMKAALSFTFFDNRTPTVLQLWRETRHHLVIPREFWKAEELGVPVVDCRPPAFPRVRIKSRIVLDKKNPGESVQRDAVTAMIASRGGILQLACVAGNTKLNLNRGGKGFETTIEEAYERTNNPGRYAWDKSIPTFIRTKMGDRIGLHLVENIIFKGLRQTIELVLEDGKKLRLTEDHEVLTTDGFVPAGQLKVRQEVIIDGERQKSVRKPRPRYKRLSWYPSHPFARKDGTRNYHLEEHRAVAEAALNKLTLTEFRERCRNGDVKGLRFIDPNKFHVHHRDEDTTNNDPGNLEALPIEEHLSGHRPGAAAFGYGIPTSIRIKRINEGRFEKVYDVACADPHHNFVANGIVVHNCGKGKTVVALEVIARLGVPALVIIDNDQLLHQWEKEIYRHLDVTPDDVGLIKADVFDWKKPIVLATYKTLANRAATFPEEVRRWFGVTIWDEAHHVAAPTFARSVDLFYGRRYGLTATPTRSDGHHVIYDFHIGPVLFKDLRQDLRPDVAFLWTGLSIDEKDPKVGPFVCDVRGELHYSKLAGYFGGWRPRLDFILDKVRELNAQGRKILVLSNSVAEIVNLLAVWNGEPALYTDVPTPTPQDVGETVPPQRLDDRDLGKYKHRLGAIYGQLKDPALNQVKRKQLELARDAIEHRLLQHTVAEKIDSEFERRHGAYIKYLVAKNGPSKAGIMIHKVKTTERTKMLEDKEVTFAITKYGREGLDNAALDTLLVCEPITDRGGLEQLMGRVQRAHVGKLKPLVLFIEDNIGLMIGMCNKLRGHLRSWPVEQGGAYDFDRVGHPQNRRKDPIWLNQRGFGQ